MYLHVALSHNLYPQTLYHFSMPPPQRLFCMAQRVLAIIPDGRQFGLRIDLDYRDVLGELEGLMVKGLKEQAFLGYFCIETSVKNMSYL